MISGVDKTKIYFIGERREALMVLVVLLRFLHLVQQQSWLHPNWEFIWQTICLHYLLTFISHLSPSLLRVLLVFCLSVTDQQKMNYKVQYRKYVPLFPSSKKPCFHQMQHFKGKLQSVTVYKIRKCSIISPNAKRCSQSTHTPGDLGSRCSMGVVGAHHVSVTSSTDALQQLFKHSVVFLKSSPVYWELSCFLSFDVAW